jgi:uncharacterized membrane protein
MSEAAGPAQVDEPSARCGLRAYATFYPTRVLVVLVGLCLLASYAVHAVIDFWWISPYFDAMTLAFAIRLAARRTRRMTWLATGGDARSDRVNVIVWPVAGVICAVLGVLWP